MLKATYETVAYASETLVFIFLGLGLFAFDHSYRRMGPMLLIVSFVGIGIGRFFNVYGISAIINKCRKNNMISQKDMVPFRMLTHSS